MIFDQSTVDRFGVFGGSPGAPVPDWVESAPTPQRSPLLWVCRSTR